VTAVLRPARATYADAAGDLVIDGVVCCPVCLEDKGSPFCCPKPTGAGAVLAVVWDAEDLKALRAELKTAPQVRVRTGGAA
jgi:hypothetical protein